MADDIAVPTGQYRVLATFETRTDAERARADLLAAGFPAGDIGMRAEVESMPDTRPREQNILGTLLDIFVFMPPRDRLTYEEALRRGGTVLAVRTDAKGYKRAMDILDRDGAIDLDEREASWQETRRISADAGTDVGGLPSAEEVAFARAGRHDPLVNPSANPDMRERIGVGTSDMTVGTDIDPPNAVTLGLGQDGASAERLVRDMDNGRRRIRGYVARPESK